MIICVNTHDIDPNRREMFAQHARTLGGCGPRCGADLIGHFAPEEVSTSTAYGVYWPPSLADCEAYRKRLAAGPLGWKSYEFAKHERFTRQAHRMFVKPASAPHEVRA